MKFWKNTQAHRGLFQIYCICVIVFGDKSFGQSPVYDSSGRPWYENGGTNGSNQNGKSQMDAMENAGFSYPSEAAKQQDLSQIDSMLRGFQQAGASNPSHPEYQAYLLALDGRQRAARTPVNSRGGMGAYGNNLGTQDAQQSMDGLRQQMEENTQQRAQQQMAADSAKYAAIRERGGHQLERAGKNLLAELDAIDAAESGSRRSSIPERVRPSADQLKMNAMKETLSDVYEGLAGEQWSSPSALEYREAESETDDPDSLVPSVQAAPYSDYGPLANDQLKNPSEMTPQERTQLYTEVDKAYHDKYPQYGEGQIDPDENPEAARKWLEERDQILASRSAPGEGVHGQVPLQIGTEQAANPNESDGKINSVTYSEAADKLPDSQNQTLVSGSEPLSTGSTAGSGGNANTYATYSDKTKDYVNELGNNAKKNVKEFADNTKELADNTKKIYQTGTDFIKSLKPTDITSTDHRLGLVDEIGKTLKKPFENFTLEDQGDSIFGGVHKDLNNLEDRAAGFCNPREKWKEFNDAVDNLKNLYHR